MSQSKNKDKSKAKKTVHRAKMVSMPKTTSKKLATTTITVHVNAKAKAKLDTIFARLDLTVSEALEKYLAQVLHHGDIPFSLNIPNKITQQALHEGMRDKVAAKRYRSAKEMFADIL
jgi:addiction module RelB/DinJ family antitoxin